MSISPALDIARRALLANEIALAVTGNNIANVNTPGYTRQAPEFESVEGGAGSAGVLIGSGVRLRDVTQLLDPLLSRRLLNSQTDLSEQTTRQDQLSQLSASVNDLSQPSLTDALSGFFDAADALARNPAGLAERQSLLGSATAVATSFNERSDAIAGQQRDADAHLVQLAGQVNQDLSQIADLNRQISATEVSGQRANDLRDQRQNVLNDLAGNIGITTSEDPRGAVTVSSVAGPVLVAGGDVVHDVAVQAGAVGLDGNVLHDLGIGSPGGPFIAEPPVFAQGEAGALLTARDQDLVTASTNLDTAAGALADAVNAIQTSPAARDLDGNPTAAVPLFTGTGAGSLTVAIVDPRRIAAALSTDPADNGNALRLADLRTAAPVSVAPASTAAAAIGNSTLSGYVAGELGRIGEAASSAATAADASSKLDAQLQSQRASLSGVNLNEELTNLLQYQRAFQASAQVLTVTNSMLDDLLRSI